MFSRAGLISSARQSFATLSAWLSYIGLTIVVCTFYSAFTLYSLLVQGPPSSDAETKEEHTPTDHDSAIVIDDELPPARATPELVPFPAEKPPSIDLGGLRAETPYILRNVLSGAALDLAGGSAEEGTPIINYHVHKGGNQQWIIEVDPHAKGEIRLRSALTGTYVKVTGPTLDGNVAQPHVAMGSTEPSNFVMHQVNGAFKLVLASDEGKTLEVSNDGLCDHDKVRSSPSLRLRRRVTNSFSSIASRRLSRTSSNASNSKVVLGNTTLYQPSQQWYFEEPESLVLYRDDSLPAPGPYLIRSKASSYAIDLAGSGKATGTPVIAFPVHKGTNQRWVFENGVNGYRLKNAASGTYLSLSAGGTIGEGEHTIGAAKMPVEFQFIRTSDETFQIVLSKHPQLVLGTSVGRKRKEGEISIQTNAQAEHQQWYVTSM